MRFTEACHHLLRRATARSRFWRLTTTQVLLLDGRVMMTEYALLSRAFAFWPTKLYFRNRSGCAHLENRKHQTGRLNRQGDFASRGKLFDCISFTYNPIDTSRTCPLPRMCADPSQNTLFLGRLQRFVWSYTQLLMILCIHPAFVHISSPVLQDGNENAGTSADDETSEVNNGVPAISRILHAYMHHSTGFGWVFLPSATIKIIIFLDMIPFKALRSQLHDFFVAWLFTDSFLLTDAGTRKAWVPWSPISC